MTYGADFGLYTDSTCDESRDSNTIDIVLIDKCIRVIPANTEDIFSISVRGVEDILSLLWTDHLVRMAVYCFKQEKNLSIWLMQKWEYTQEIQGHLQKLPLLISQFQ